MTTAHMARYTLVPVPSNLRSCMLQFSVIFLKLWSSDNGLIFHSIKRLFIVWKLCPKKIKIVPSLWKSNIHQSHHGSNFPAEKLASGSVHMGSLKTPREQKHFKRATFLSTMVWVCELNAKLSDIRDTESKRGGGNSGALLLHYESSSISITDTCYFLSSTEKSEDLL